MKLFTHYLTIEKLQNSLVTKLSDSGISSSNQIHLDHVVLVILLKDIFHKASAVILAYNDFAVRCSVGDWIYFDYSDFQSADSFCIRRIDFAQWRM